VTSVDHHFCRKMAKILWMLLVLGVVLPRHTTVGSLASGGPAGGDGPGPVTLPIPFGANMRERMVAVGGRGGRCGQCARRLRGGGGDPSLEEKAGQDLDTIYDSIRLDGHSPSFPFRPKAHAAPTPFILTLDTVPGSLAHAALPPHRDLKEEFMEGMEGGEDGLPTRYRFVLCHPDSLTSCSLLCGTKIMWWFPPSGLFC